MPEDLADGGREHEGAHKPQPTAESVLSGHRLGHQGVGRPNEEASGVAQARESKGCGREDSNLPEFCLTSSLVDTRSAQSLN